jgi:DNA replication and repair protein RecF
MQISSLTMKNYRSYASLAARFSDGINILQGHNAAGKTNVLEAVGFLSFGKSFRTQKDTECIKDGGETAYIKGGISTRQGSLQIEALISAAEKKSLKVNGQPVRRMGELLGNFIAVVFSPEDLKVLKESPSLRRRFIDMEISKLHPAYFYELQDYSKALAQKNALLKSRMAENQLKKLVTIFNEQLATHGEKIIKARQEFLMRLHDVGRDIHKDLSGGETLDLKYRSSVQGPDIRQALFDKMDKSLTSEIEQGFTLYGPHREDFSVSLGGAEIKSYSSQGQLRTAMLSLKLATFDIAQADFGESPVLLLDDVFSELDENRQAALLTRIKGAQCFITSAVPVKSALGKVYTVAGGTVTADSTS